MSALLNAEPRLSERCQWDPATDSEAGSVGGCPNKATVLVGRGMDALELCMRCAQLPRFRGIIKRPLAGRQQ